MMYEKIKGIVLFILVGVSIVLMLAGIAGFISGIKTSGDIEEIRRVYRELEIAYSGVRESVGKISGDIRGIGEGLSRVETGIGSLEIRTAELRKGLQQASSTLGKVSGTVGELEALNREFSSILDSLVTGQ